MQTNFLYNSVEIMKDPSFAEHIFVNILSYIIAFVDYIIYNLFLFVCYPIVPGRNPRTEFPAGRNSSDRIPKSLSFRSDPPHPPDRVLREK